MGRKTVRKENAFKDTVRSVICVQGVLEYHLIRKPVKNINLRIKSDGQILISANSAVPADYLDDFVKRKQDFIFRALEDYQKRRKNEPAVPKKYETGEGVDILGKRYRLIVTEGEKESVRIDGDCLNLVVKDKENFKKREKMFGVWQKNLQRAAYDEICREIYRLFERYGIAYPEVKIRSMTSRWGSCQPVKGIITLNSKLIQKPKRCIEYVVLHEFAHFIHPNHSKDFYAFVEMLMPDWKERKEELNSIH